jgi:hypothetical protein
MAKYGVTNIAGGGGVGSDEISVTKEYVLDGKTYVGADTDDEIGTGAMANNGATGNQNLNAGSSFSVKKGYHTQDFTVIANSLASQTSGTAIPSHVLNGETYWTNGNKITGTMNVQSILSFSCAPYSFSQIIFSWQNPTQGPFSGVIIVGKTGGYPANISDGTWYYKGFGNNKSYLGVSNTVVGGFGVNTSYYFRAFSYAVINGSDNASGTTRIANTIIQQVTQVITSSTTWTVPNGINQVQVFLVGGGGGGGYNSAMYGGEHSGFGGGSGYTTTQTVSVTPGQQIPIVIGAGGRGYLRGSGDDGNATSFGSVIAQGGTRGTWFESSSYNKGGSGGGAGGIRNENYRRYQNGGSGGADGSNGNPSFFTGDGESGLTGNGGSGQGSTTRAFGESWNTLYAGGGGGGAGLRADSHSSAYDAGSPGQGGSGGGGQGNTGTADNGNATPNTGGGGGGAAPTTNSKSTRYSGSGGSGICILRYIG